MDKVFNYFSTLNNLLHQVQTEMSIETSIDFCRDLFYTTVTQRCGKLIFIGNGGSSAIASHMAIDYTKNGHIRSISLNDPAAITCIANDYGWDEVFAKQLEVHLNPMDVLIAISSSGASRNMMRATKVAKMRKCPIVTLTGFNDDNYLRKQGDVNFYVPCHEYGMVEISHLVILHAILDIEMGWPNPLTYGKKDDSVSV